MALQLHRMASPIGTVPLVSDGAAVSPSGSAGPRRAVGLANGANPVAIVVPCYRVIGADSGLTGYGGGLRRSCRENDHVSAA